MTLSIARRAWLPVAIISSLALAACGSGDPLADTETAAAPSAPAQDAATDSATGGAAAPSSDAGGDKITVGGANFTEINVMEEIYAALLRDAGYEVDIVTSDSREIYAPALVDGQIDVIPEYAATMTEYLNREANGPDAPVVATADPATTIAAMQPLAEAVGLVVLEPAEASSQNGWAIPTPFATEQDITTLTQYALVMPQIRLAATEECPDRPFCQPGLESLYGFEVTELLPLGYASPQAKQAVISGAADMVLVGTTDATLEADGLTLLEDDKALQLADNLVPVLTAELAEDQTVVDTLNSLSAVLTTEDLAELNRRVDVDRELAADVASSYLEEQGLIG